MEAIARLQQARYWAQEFLAMISEQKATNEEGMTVLSVLVAVVILAIIGLSLARNTIASLQIMKVTEVNNAASNLAVSRIEELAGRDASDIDASLNANETNITYAGLGITFNRTTTITVNADDTRDIEVRVVSNSSAVPSDVSFTTSLSVWE